MSDLVEPGMKYFINQTLIKCKELKDRNTNLIYNISLFIGFVIVLGLFLYYRHKSKLSTKEEKEKDNKKKIYMWNLMKSRNKTEITGLGY